MHHSTFPPNCLFFCNTEAKKVRSLKKSLYENHVEMMLKVFDVLMVSTVTKLVLVLFSTGRNLKFSWISRKRRHEILCFFSNLIRNKTFWWWAILPWTIFLEIKLCKHNAIFGHGIRHKKSVEKNKKILSLGHLLFLSLWQCNGKTDLVRKLIVFLLIINNR